MRVIRQYWYVGLLLLGTIGLGLTTFLISLRLQQKEQVTPATPHAQVANSPTPAASTQCTLAFSLTIPTNTPIGNPTATNTPVPSNTPVPTATNTPVPNATNTPVPTATNTPLPTNTSVPTATNTPVPTNTPLPTATPTPVPLTCNQYCTSNSQCDGGLVCSNNYCRASACTDQAGCVCPSPTPWPTNTPAPGACSAGCTTNSQCANNLICSNGLCRNPDCTDQPNCACYFVPTPKVPVTGTGTTALGLGIIGGGIILLLLGLAF